VGAATILEIGSVSKALTGTLLAEMAARGEVALEDPVRRYLPDSVQVPARAGREITLLDLASHTSGLPRLPDNLAPADSEDPYADYDVGRLHRFLSGHTLRREPGSAYEYSNLGAGLLGHALERAGGRPYEVLMVERVLAPLGMHDTRITLTQGQRARLAGGHGADLAPVKGWTFDALAGAGAWRSTVLDVLRLLGAMLDPPAGTLGEAFIAAMEPRRSAGGPGLRIGLGWHVLEREGRTLTWHNGETGGFHSFVAVDRAARTGVVVLSNAATNIDDIGFHLLIPALPLREPAPPRPTVEVPVATLERYVGRYELAPGFVIEVTLEDGALHAQATGQPRFRLYAASPTRFFLRVVEAEVGFTEDAAGAVTGLVLYQGGREMPGRKLK
jgi:CubicO group peptidase (beta-lactamase class C family)